MKKPNETNHKHMYFTAGIIAIAILILAASVGYSAYSNSHSKPLALESYQVNASPTPVTVAQQAPVNKSIYVAPSPLPTLRTDYSFQISKIKTALDLANGYDLQKMLASNQEYYDECMQFSSAPDNANYCAQSKQNLDAKVNGDNAVLQLRKDNLNHLLQVFQAGNPTQADFDLYSKTINS